MLKDLLLIIISQKFFSVARNLLILRIAILRRFLPAEYSAIYKQLKAI